MICLAINNWIFLNVICNLTCCIAYEAHERHGGTSYSF